MLLNDSIDLSSGLLHSATLDARRARNNRQLGKDYRDLGLDARLRERSPQRFCTRRFFSWAGSAIYQLENTQACAAQSVFALPRERKDIAKLQEQRKAR